MTRVVFDLLTRKQFLRLPPTDPPLVYRDGMVIQEGNGHWIYRDMSLEQFLRLPDAKPALEYVDGMVVQGDSLSGSHVLPGFVLPLNELFDSLLED